MSKIFSKDGTPISYDRSGEGPAVVIVGGILGDRSQQAPLAALLSPAFQAGESHRVLSDGLLMDISLLHSAMTKRDRESA